MSSKRKQDHIDICLKKNVEAGTTGFEDVKLIYNAMPDVNLDSIKTNVKFLEKELKAPILIGAITGGTIKSKKINKNLAKAAQELGIGMGVGSQRAGIENEKLENTYQVRDVAPDILLLANLGLIQFNNGFTAEHAKKAVDMIQADALAIHINALQELHQKEGNVNWESSLKKLAEICRNTDFPIIVKECGAGISREAALNIEWVGAKAIDVNGSGGTSWSLVEAERNKERTDFADFGIPTAMSLAEVSKEVNIPVIAGGGIRTGQDIAKAIAMGAEVVSIALPLLKPATISANAVKKELEKIITELKKTMFLVGAKDIEELRKAPIIITGKTREWLEARNIKVKKFAK